MVGVMFTFYKIWA